ncbi:MAG: polymer-forming cytoskeletal protein [Desulfarculaceae bacterium]|nr:polymer-forming cytoskeletal protein [Desulfarculaceae bacterium]MCF8073640.1 polymer-forming cytoskeletal protein [Desulfarculaceae bacterium]MCF8103128.1 polymer-forming cytoskeletal protein [Desulfarculaceae bacterium]MCF8115644.1 polymer-forming cytoskeletal protein [Desulfarculaceae bacterium]
MGRKGRESHVNFYLGQGIRQEGLLTFKGQARVDGEFKGEIQGEGLVLVGSSAMVEAKIRADRVVISGRVTGNVEATERIELKKPGNLIGDVTAPLVMMEEGVRFEGHCHMALDQDKEEAGRLKLLGGGPAPGA